MRTLFFFFFPPEMMRQMSNRMKQKPVVTQHDVYDSTAWLGANKQRWFGGSSPWLSHHNVVQKHFWPSSKAMNQEQLGDYVHIRHLLRHAPLRAVTQPQLRLLVATLSYLSGRDAADISCPRLSLGAIFLSPICDKLPFVEVGSNQSGQLHVTS